MTRQTRERRERLFRKHPYCFWCSRRLVHPRAYTDYRGQRPDNMATLDHLDDRCSPLRGAFTNSKHERTVLACRECNERRGRESWRANKNMPLRAENSDSPEMVLGVGVEPTKANFKGWLPNRHSTPNQDG